MISKCYAYTVLWTIFAYWGLWYPLFYVLNHVDEVGPSFVYLLLGDGFSCYDIQLKCVLSFPTFGLL